MLDEYRQQGKTGLNGACGAAQIFGQGHRQAKPSRSLPALLSDVWGLAQSQSAAKQAFERVSPDGCFPALNPEKHFSLLDDIW